MLISLISEMMNESFVVGPNEEAFEIEEDLFKCGVCAYTSRFKQNVRRQMPKLKLLHLVKMDVCILFATNVQIDAAHFCNVFPQLRFIPA